MLGTKNRKRRIININKHPHLRKSKCPTVCPFKDHLEQMNKEWQALIHRSYLAKDPKFLRRMAIHIKQLHHDAKNMQKKENFQGLSQRIAHFLSTPLGAPFVSKETLVKAAYLYSEQVPEESDLCIILSEFALYGAFYPMQLLSPFS